MKKKIKMFFLMFQTEEVWDEAGAEAARLGLKGWRAEVVDRDVKTAIEEVVRSSKRGYPPLPFFSLLNKKIMNAIIAVPLAQGILCPHFGHCEQFAIIKVENGKITNEEAVTPPEHQPGLYPKWIAQYGVTDVIAGGMGQRAIDLFNEQSINVFVGAPLHKASVLVSDFIAGNLKLESNYCDH
jgi:predicted Fe-Mo cluster-binding NifX family protein